MFLFLTKRRFFWILTIVAFSVAFWVGYKKLQAQWHKSATDLFRVGTIRRGDVKFEVKCTGAVQPVLSVQVGAVVSGPIKEVLVDFNDKVEEGQLLAKLDPKVYEAQRLQAQSTLSHSLADLKQFKAKLRQTERDLNRAKTLHNMTGIPGSNHAVKGIAEGDYDMAVANFEMAEANVEVAKATVEQNEASLKLADANLSYTTITSPVSGIVIDRKVDAGQTLASLYQTPVMFVVAPELDKRVFIQASIDEADIGFVRKAKENEQPVHFTVDAYQNEEFEGKIIQVRLGPKAALPNAQANVVTYVAVVEAPNTELKLLPGMTANLVFRIEQHDGVLKIPNAALRFHPKPEFVHPKHLPVLEGLKTEEEKEESGTASKDKADEKADDEADENEKDVAKKSEEKSAEKAGDDASGEKKNADAMDDSKEKSNGKKKDGKKKDDKKKYVWIIDGELLSPVEVKTKLVDSRHTELVSGELKDGDKVVTGMKTAAEAAAAKK